MEGKTTIRYKERLDPPLTLYIPQDFKFYQNGLFESRVNFLTYFMNNPLGKMEYFPLKIKQFNNELDEWIDNEFKAYYPDNEHEGLIIHKETRKPFDYIYLIHIIKKRQEYHPYIATLLPFNIALTLCKSAKNEILYDKLMELVNNESTKKQLFETKIKKELKKYKSETNSPKLII